jgi:hypothetical protein
MRGQAQTPFFSFVLLEESLCVSISFRPSLFLMVGSRDAVKFDVYRVPRCVPLPRQSEGA